MLYLALLFYFLPLVPASLGTTPAIDDNPTEHVTSDLCNVAAWVRAPDLNPGQIIQGQVRIRTNGTCNHIASYSLGLRFAERAWVKTRKAEVELPSRPKSLLGFDFGNSSDIDIFGEALAWRHFGYRNADAWESYEQDIKNPSLWLVKEKERVGFEALLALQKPADSGHSQVEDFAILVPLSNYPPAYDPYRGGGWSLAGDGLDEAGSEHIYAYFVQVSLTNGTTYEVPAGFTSFQAKSVHTPTSSPHVLNGTMETRFTRSKEVSAEINHQDVFKIEVNLTRGIYLQQGSINNISVTVHRSGLGIEKPTDISLLVYTDVKNDWAASLAADNETAKALQKVYRVKYHLRPSEQDTLHHGFAGRKLEQVPVDGCYFGNISLPQDMFPSTRMAFTTYESNLKFYLHVSNFSETIESNSTQEEKEDYEWVPTVKDENIRGSRNVRSLEATIPVFVQASTHDDEVDGNISNLTHYLSPAARSPIFVQLLDVQELLHKSPAERDLLAPMAQPVIIEREGQDVVKRRYYTGLSRKETQGYYYVGNTWLRKVVKPAEKERNDMAGNYEESSNSVQKSFQYFNNV